MTSKGMLTQKQTGSPLDHLPPASSVNKPVTPFSIVDILKKPSVNRGTTVVLGGKLTCSVGISLPSRKLVTKASPLCALEELASKTFKGVDVGVLQAVEGKGFLTLYGQRHHAKKRRKSRTAFTASQIQELEKRFVYQKYLTQTDRDHIAHQLALTNAQVITWFQNRRAKLKRDLEELKADVKSATAIGSVPLEKLDKLADLERLVNGTAGHRSADSWAEREIRMPPACPFSPADHTTRAPEQHSSDNEDEEIDVD
ncbi:transcription factor LBX1b-like [Engraulis encrasicolus]|uniref:transcription factor LBX1b-like n=1 Tax=Engraulis encrasicolus TaxID=184585 RepID=UPI002FD79CF6